MSENEEKPQPPPADNSNNPLKKIKKPLPNKPFKPKFNFYWVWGIILLGLIMTEVIGNMNMNVQEISFPSFVEKALAPRLVSKIVIVNNDVAEVYLKPQALTLPQFKDVAHTQTGPQYDIKIISGDSFMQMLNDAQKTYPDNEKIYPEKDTRTDWTGYIQWLLPVGLMVLLLMFFMRRVGGGGGNQIFSIGKSKATLFDKDTNVNITFNDVAGLEEAKVEIKEIVEFLKTPQKYVALGAKIPKGALLVGPPGTGKTLLAKAVAGEAKVPFFSLSGSDFVEMFVGVGASRVRDLFRQAKEKAPCIIFIDEIDAIGRARGRNIAQGSNDERENTLNQLLTEMDGFTNTSGIIILAATNRADILDRALLRPGRFDRQIYVDMPDLTERKEIFKVHLKPLKTDGSLDIDFLAKQTPGFSGADIANVCNEAALIAARRDKKMIDKQDFLDAVDRVVGGLEKKNRLISPSEKKVIAFHEAGHAVVSWLLEYAHPLVKVTIIPRGKSLGAAWYLPEERQITTTEQMMDEMCAALGGRAAEEIMFGKISTGALSDLEKITKQAYAMIMYYGLNKKIGNVSFYDSSGGSEYTFTKPYSEKTAESIDNEVTLMIETAYIKTKELIKTHKEQLIEVAQQLLDNEVIFKEDLEKIIGKRPFEKEIAEPMSQHKKIFANGAPKVVTPTPSTNGSANGAEETKTAPPVAEAPKAPPVIVMEEKEMKPEDLKKEEAAATAKKEGAKEKKKKEPPQEQEQDTEDKTAPPTSPTLF
ncbi:MAG TPA: ATP-dependent zinc metalloprotease FtsH [Bacteroidia bacterium]|nr:ATP-dependent zinc metalloprotease FtsH [Bacteroidia bacterium]